MQLQVSNWIEMRRSKLGRSAIECRRLALAAARTVRDDERRIELMQIEKRKNHKGKNDAVRLAPDNASSLDLYRRLTFWFFESEYECVCWRRNWQRHTVRATTFPFLMRQRYNQFLINAHMDFLPTCTHFIPHRPDFQRAASARCQ